MSKQFRVSDEYGEKIQKWADEGKRPFSSQIEILADYFEGMQKMTNPKPKKEPAK